jgi:hypothetical protein
MLPSQSEPLRVGGHRSESNIVFPIDQGGSRLPFEGPAEPHQHCANPTFKRVLSPQQSRQPMNPRLRDDFQQVPKCRTHPSVIVTPSQRNHPKNKAERFQDVRPAFHAAIPDMREPYAQKAELMFAVISKQCSQLICQPDVIIWPWWDSKPATRRRSRSAGAT